MLDSLINLYLQELFVEIYTMTMQTSNNALRASGFFSLQADGDEAGLALDSDITSGGNNPNVGQRQIVAFARAIVRNSKLLILDEGERFFVSKSPR